MEKKHDDLLRKNHMLIVRNMSADLIASELAKEYTPVFSGGGIKKGIFSENDVNTISKLSTPEKRNEQVLNFLKRRGANAYEEFTKALSKVTSSGHVKILEALGENELASSSQNRLTASIQSADVKSPSGEDVVPQYNDLPDGRPEPEGEGGTVEDGPFGFGGGKHSRGHMEQAPPHAPLSSDYLEEGTYYPMNKSPRGIFLLINNKTFLPSSGMHEYPRNGTDHDAAAMEAMFRELGYIVRSYTNISVYDMRKIYSTMAAEDFSSYCAFASCILSHGQEGVIYGIDGTIDIKELTGMFRGSNLAGKPKMFFFQACQGSEYMDAVEADGPLDDKDGRPGDDRDEYGNKLSLPTEADFLYAYSTVPGYYSWRNSAKGSWFIQAIVEVFRKHAHKMDVVRMLTRVNNIVSTKKSQTGQRASHHKRQISSIVTQLRKELYLFPPHGPMRVHDPMQY